MTDLNSQILAVLGQHLDITDADAYAPLVNDLAKLVNKGPPKVRRSKKAAGSATTTKRAGNPYSRFVKAIAAMNKDESLFDANTISFTIKDYVPPNDKASQRWSNIQTYFEFDGAITLKDLHDKVCDPDLTDYLGNAMVKASIMWGMLPDSAKASIDAHMHTV